MSLGATDAGPKKGTEENQPLLVVVAGAVLTVLAPGPGLGTGRTTGDLLLASFLVSVSRMVVVVVAVGGGRERLDAVVVLMGVVDGSILVSPVEGVLVRTLLSTETTLSMTPLAVVLAPPLVLVLVLAAGPSPEMTEPNGGSGGRGSGTGRGRGITNSIALVPSLCGDGEEGEDEGVVRGGEEK